MESKHHDSVTFYKKLEEECNKRIHAHTNCRDFTISFGKMMENHLDQVLVHKKLITKWLDCLDIPNKDEIAALSIRIIDYQEKLDSLDETFYMIRKRQKVNQIQLKMVRKTFEELLSVFEKEVKELQDCKIKTLEKELLELKQIFLIDTKFIIEENEND